MGGRLLLAAAFLAACPAAWGSAGAAAKPRPPADPASLTEAASLYHQGLYDSARVRLESLLLAGPWRRRDSLVLYQYLGMAWSREGSDAPAVARFRDLLDLDSLFRFPRNEDPAVLRNFEAARQERAGRAAARTAPPVPPGLSAPDPAPQALFASPPPEDPLRALGPGSGRVRPMTFALGAVPLGAGWLARRRTTPGLALGLVQAGGLILSLYASEVQSGMQDDDHGIRPEDRDRLVRWQWTQRVSLGTALGAYLFSMIAATGE